MTDCTGLADRMPVVAHGRAAWSPAEQAHLAECRECAAEWNLIQAAARIGVEAVSSVAPEFMATRVTAALRRPGPGRLPWLRSLRWAVLPIAAAAALLVWRGSAPTAPGGTEAAPVVASVDLLPELDGMEADDLEALLDLLPAAAVPVGDLRIGDLNEEELQTMLRAMEG